MLFVLALLLCVAAIIGLVARPYYGILISIVATPIVAATWQTRIGDISLNHVLGGIVPLLVLPRLLNTDVSHPRWAKWKTACGLFVIANGLGVLPLIANSEYLSAVETTVHTMNCFVAFFFFAVFYRSDEGVRHLVTALLIAGAFPIGVGVYQAATGDVWQERYSAGIVRNVGFYHDAVSIKHFGLQTLLGIYLAFYCFRMTTLRKQLLVLYAALCLLVIFNAYTKSAIAILCGWFLIWALMQNRFVMGAVILAAFACLNLILDGFLTESITQLFWKEIAFNKGELDSRYLLTGRVSIWQDLLVEWREISFFKKAFGAGKMIPAHNEYLRIMVTSGVCGLIAFVVAMCIVVAIVAEMVFKVRKPLQMAATFALSMWWVDCIGIHPGIYSYYMWCVWGLTGLAVSATPQSNYQLGRLQPLHPFGQQSFG